MNKRFLALAGVATVLSVGTYVGLNIVKPYKHEEPKVADVTSPDQVFGASVDNPEAHADEAAAAPAAAGAAPAEAAAVQPADTSVQPAAAGQAGTAPAPAAEPAAATASAGDGSVAPLVPAGPAGAAPAAAPSTETAAAAAPAPAPEPAAPAPAAEPAPAPEPVAEAPAPAPKPKKAVRAASSKKSSGSGSSTKVWWPAEQPNKLSLVYAGPASFKKAVVLMFNGAFFKADGIDANIKVTDKAGKAVAGSWEIGENNRRMLVFPVADAGTYKVSIATGLTDSKGHKPGKALSGPVVIK